MGLLAAVRIPGAAPAANPGLATRRIAPSDGRRAFGDVPVPVMARMTASVCTDRTEPSSLWTRRMRISSRQGGVKSVLTT